MQAPSHPVLDAHTHLGRWLRPGADWMAADLAGDCSAPWAAPDVDALIDLMDAHGVVACVNLDGRWGDELEANLERYDRSYPERFLTCCQLDWRLAERGDDFAGPLVESLAASARAGACGLKIWKTLGLGFRDSVGRLLLPDDDRIASVFRAACELGLPVLIHTADPVAFWDPVDHANERLADLLEHPEWSYARPDFPAHAQLMHSFEAAVARHPATTFVGLHLASNVEDLEWVGRMLRDYPNLFVDVAGRRPDLAGRRDATRRLMLEHPDRVLFGTDELPLSADAYRAWFAFLEGLDLPSEVLRNVYADNARSVLTSERGSHAGTA